MADDGCGCIEVWHEHPDAPRGSVALNDDDGEISHWLRLVLMDDRVVCPLGDFEIIGDPSLLIHRGQGQADAS